MNTIIMECLQEQSVRQIILQLLFSFALGSLYFNSCCPKLLLSRTENVERFEFEITRVHCLYGKY